MATIAEQINAGLCFDGSITGTNVTGGCINQIKKMRSSWYIKPGEEFRAGETFASEFDRLIKKQALIVQTNVETIEENGNEDNVDTSDSGNEQVTQEGLYKLSLTFKNGLFFNKAQHLTLKGYKRWNHIFVTADGVYGTKTATGGLTGFTTGMIQPSKLQFGTSSEAQVEGLMLQYLIREELDIDFAFISDRSARKLEGVTEIALSFANTPSDADTTVTVKAAYAQDLAEPFTGVDFSKFLLTKNGTSSNPTAGDDSATEGTYPLTVAALSLNDELSIRLYDNSNNSPVITGPDGGYFRSASTTSTVIA